MSLISMAMDSSKPVRRCSLNKRMGSKLITAADHLGRPVFTDEQMQTYRLHFERDFQADGERWLTIIDATEGGVDKAHTQAMPLAEALAPFRDAEPVRIPQPRARGPRVLLLHRLPRRGVAMKVPVFSRPPRLGGEGRATACVPVPCPVPPALARHTLHRVSPPPTRASGVRGRRVCGLS